MKFEKKYFSIGEVADEVEVKEHVLRFWEKEFDFLKPIKNNAGHRKYTRNDINLIKRIKYLVYDQKYTIPGARQQLSEERDSIFDEFTPKSTVTQKTKQYEIPTQKVQPKIKKTIDKTYYEKPVQPVKPLPTVKEKPVISDVNPKKVIPITKDELIHELLNILKCL